MGNERWYLPKQFVEELSTEIIELLDYKNNANAFLGGIGILCMH